MDAAFSYDYYRFVLGKPITLPLSLIQSIVNYSKIIINNGPEFYGGRLKKELVTKL